MKKIALFDMDGLLADFTQGALAFHGKNLPPKSITWDFPTQIGFETTGCPKFWNPISNPEFWAALPVHEDGMALFRRVEAAIGKDRIGFLSSGLCPGSCDGKRMWLDQHLPGYSKRTIFCTLKHLAAAPNKVLIDDHDPNLFGNEKMIGFIPAGGLGLLIPRPWNSLAHETDEQGNFDVGSVLDRLIPILES